MEGWNGPKVGRWVHCRDGHCGDRFNIVEVMEDELGDRFDIGEFVEG